MRPLVGVSHLVNSLFHYSVQTFAFASAIRDD
jgi:hypothetical protein